MALNFPSQKLFFFFIPVIVLLGVFMLVKDKFIFTSEERGRGLAVIESNITPREKLPELD